MIKAVFFDWFNTLAVYDPPREELQSQAFREFGIDISPEEILPALLVADKIYTDANAVLPVQKRSPEEQNEFWVQYERGILSEAGINIDVEPSVLLGILKKAQELSSGMKFALFDDVISTLKSVKERNLTTGLLTNLTTDMKPIFDDLGLNAYIDIVVTSGEVGFDKPEPAFFQAALQMANVNASEAVHVGDQPTTDILGARGVGITPILIDRFELNPDVKDCIRIKSLTELIQYI